MTPTTPAKSDLSTRVITAVVLLPIVLTATGVGDWAFAIVGMFIAGIGTLEFVTLGHLPHHRVGLIVGVLAGLAVTLSFQVNMPMLWQIGLLLGLLVTFAMHLILSRKWRQSINHSVFVVTGILYVAFPAGFLIWVRGREDGLIWILAIFLATWCTDTVAYFAGRFFGRHKLAPKISPKKTVEGAIGGIVGGIIPTLLLLMATDLLTFGSLIVVVLAPLMAIAGDLLESMLKRRFKVKDSFIPGLNIFPGHGGVLDRVDSLLAVTTLFYAYLIVIGAS